MNNPADVLKNVRPQIHVTLEKEVPELVSVLRPFTVEEILPTLFCRIRMSVDRTPRSG
jgi:hypothetical protein